MSTVRAALIKLESDWGQVQHNISQFERMALDLKGHNPDLIITPECFLDGYMERDKENCTKERIAECSVSGVDDPLLVRVAAISKELNSYTVFGATEKGAGGSLRNAAYLFGRHGEHVGTYYKVQTKTNYDPGDELPVFDTDFGKIGIVICADRRWPENIRCLRLKGAELIANPTWGFYGDLNTSLVRVRAYENGIPICFAHPKQALICGPKGAIDAIMESNIPGVLVHDIDLTQNISTISDPNKEVSACKPIQHRRPELYQALVEQTRDR